MTPKLSEAIAVLSQSRESWGVDMAAFTQFVESRPHLEKGAHLEDVLLAFGAGTRCEGATYALAVRIQRLTLSSKRARVSADTLEEARQRLLERMLVARDGEAPKIATYDGQGALDAWLSVSLAREAIALDGKVARESPWDEILSPVDLQTPEDKYFKSLYQEKYKQAFETAANELSSKERAILRQHLLLGLSIDRIGDMYGVHRVTASRWVNDARATLLANMRKRLEQTLELPRGELDKVAERLESG